MRNRFTVGMAVVIAVAIMITVPFNGIILPSLAVAQQQQMNSNTSSQGTSSSSNPLTLNSIFKQVNNSVVQITSKTPTAGVANPSNQSSSNGTGFVYDKQGHIVTNGHVVGDAKVVARWQQIYCKGYSQ